MNNAIYRLSQVKIETGLPRSTIYLRIQQGLLTKPISLGGRSVGWPAIEISQINAARIAGKSNEEIKNLVDELENQRGKERRTHHD